MVNPSLDSGIEILEGMRGVTNQITGAVTGQRYKELQYWRKCKGCQIHTQELGWIVLGPAMSQHTAVEYYQYQRSKHAEPLDKYGTYATGKASVGSDKSKYNVVESGFNRFEPLIEQNGFHEFPIDQMIAYNWHRYPTFVKYVPELANVEEFPCTYCEGRRFTQPEHLRIHISAKHENVAQPVAIGKEISKAIESVGSSGGQSMSPEVVAQLVVAVREALRAESPK